MFTKAGESAVNASGKTRQSNIELLRIIIMIGIVAHHFSVHGGYDFSTETVTLNRIWIQFIELGGKIGVNIFALISGYFLISSNSIKIEKVLKLMMQILTYSVFFFLLFGVLKNGSLNVRELIKACFPITFSQWWFASAYFMLFLISPYLNRFLESLDRSACQRMLLLLTICWSFIPTFTGQSFQSNNLLWLIYMYSLGAYFRLHDIYIYIRA